MIILLALAVLLLIALGSNVANAQVQAASSSVIGMHVSDGSLTGGEITNNIATWPGENKTWDICAAVAKAEGYDGPSNVSYLLNNPGDVGPGDENGQKTAGPPQAHDKSLIVHFATAEGGWQALYTKFDRIINDESTVYNSSMSWEEVGKLYAGDSQNWIHNVTNYLGVDPSTTPLDYVNS